MFDLTGIGMYAWRLNTCEGGNVDALCEVAAGAKLSHILSKIANWTSKYNTSVSLPRYSEGLQALGIQHFGWHYVAGEDPKGEARLAAEQIRYSKVSAYVIDAESEYKLPKRAENARVFLAELRSLIGNFPIGLSSYRYPSLHKEFPWKEFLSGVDFVMPQVYWQGSTNSGVQLKRSLAEFKMMESKYGYRPISIYPTGAAYREHGWQAKPKEITEFLQTALDLGLPAVNFWEWWHSRTALPENFQAIQSFPWPNKQDDTEEKPPLELPERVRLLEEQMKEIRERLGLPSA